MITALLLYFHYVIIDGDYMNDQATHLPSIVRPFVEALGAIIAALLGS